MPYETEITGAGIVWRYSGTVTFDEIVESNSEAWGLPDWPSLKYQIVDFSNAERLSITPYEASGFVGFDRAAARSTSDMRVALVSDDPEIAALCELYVNAMDIDGWEARLFSTREAAEKWATRGQSGG